MLPEHGPMSRTYNFVKQLNRMGHHAVGFGASHPHNTNLQLIGGKEKFVKWKDCDTEWVYVKTCDYKGSKLKRIYAMFQFYFNTKQAVRQFGKPDAIIGSSAPPTDMLLAIKLARKYKCKAITEVRDLWPESIVAYGILGARNPIVWALRKFEKWAYTKADACIFTMEGGKDYIIEQGWDTVHGGPVDLNKVHHINNGVDLELFDYNKEHYITDDSDLDNPETFKVVYTGSIRKVNNLGQLLDVAKLVKNPKVKFLIWGNGNELSLLQSHVQDEKIDNVVFKGQVEKKYIPYILSMADLNLAHNAQSKMFDYGISFNKMFDYLASGKFTLFDFYCKYNCMANGGAGVQIKNPTPEKIADEIDKLSESDLSQYKDNINNLITEYDFSNLTKKLLDAIKGV